jgi:hypothetical protein
VDRERGISIIREGSPLDQVPRSTRLFEMGQRSSLSPLQDTNPELVLPSSVPFYF